MNFRMQEVVYSCRLKTNPYMKKTLIAAALLCGAALSSQAGVSFRFGLNLPLPGFMFSAPVPVYVAPPPVYYAAPPVPVYYAAPPAVVSVPVYAAPPAPVIVYTTPYPYYGPAFRGYYGPRPYFRYGR